MRRKMSRENAVLLAQFALSIAWGGPVYVALLPDASYNPKVPILGGLIVGFAGQWATMFVYFWIRFGWRAARSMRMDNQPRVEGPYVTMTLPPIAAWEARPSETGGPILDAVPEPTERPRGPASVQGRDPRRPDYQDTNA